MVCRPAALLLACLLATACGRAATAAADGVSPRVTLAGTLVLPDAAPGPEGADLTITGLSGITWLGDDRYAAIMDNSDRLLLIRLALDASGRPEQATDLSIVVLGEAFDYEDLAPCPAPLADRIARRRRDRGEAVPERILLACEETTPAIRALDRDTGSLLGIVPLPDIMRTSRPNRGLESLTVTPDGGGIWTANEEALPADGPAATAGGGTIVRLARIAVPDAADAKPAAEFAYAVDPPHNFVRIFAGEPLSGVVALVALDADRLLVLERSGGPGLPPFEKRIYLVDTTVGTDVSPVPGGLADRADLHLPKALAWRDTLGCNVEGLCLGPQLPGGGRALVGVADNGGLGTPNQLVALVLHDDPAAFDATWLTAAAALAGVGLLVRRLTSP